VALWIDVVQEGWQFRMRLAWSKDLHSLWQVAREAGLQLLHQCWPPSFSEGAAGRNKCKLPMR